VHIGKRPELAEPLGEALAQVNREGSTLRIVQDSDAVYAELRLCAPVIASV
jgi:hypothetical protein